MLDRVPAVSTRINMTLQLFEGHIIVGRIVSSKPSQLQVVSVYTYHKYNTHKLPFHKSHTTLGH